jgi:hypothetical protein
VTLIVPGAGDVFFNILIGTATRRLIPGTPKLCTIDGARMPPSQPRDSAGLADRPDPRRAHGVSDTYGARGVHAELTLGLGLVVGHGQVEMLMACVAIKGCSARAGPGLGTRRQRRSILSSECSPGRRRIGCGSPAPALGISAFAEKTLVAAGLRAASNGGCTPSSTSPHSEVMCRITADIGQRLAELRARNSAQFPRGCERICEH